MSSSWTAGTVYDLAEALGLPCEEFPCSWPIEDFRTAMRNAGGRARLNRAYASIREWLIGIDEMSMPDGYGSEVYVA